MNTKVRQITILLLLLAAMVGCATKIVKSTTYTPVIQDSSAISEDFLLDVGIAIFNPGLDDITKEDEDTTNPQIRIAESRYAPYLLADTLQRSGNWGIVRVIPTSLETTDIALYCTILRSNGETMRIKVSVSDSSGSQWYTKEYEEHISQFNYDTSQRKINDPFQVIYNHIANDLLAFKKKNISDSEITTIRAISEIKFAKSFSPEVFDAYLTQNKDGIYELVRLPSDSDPVLSRIRDMRERDYMFIDTVQDYYATYNRGMKLSYDAWREQSFYETITLQELRKSAKRRFIAGTAAIIGGLAAASSGNWQMRNGGAIGVGAGGYLIKSGFDKRAEARLHVDALEELGASLESEMTPQVIALDDRTITLTGNVEDQYQQWREILAEIYQNEVGGT